MLAYALAYKALAMLGAMEKLASVLPDSKGDAIKGWNVRLRKLKVRRGLREFGNEGGCGDGGGDCAGEFVLESSEGWSWGRS